MSAHLSHTTVAVIAGGALLVLFLLWRGSRNRAKRATHQITRTTGSVGRALLSAGLIVAMQWAVLTHVPGITAGLLALGIPALFAGTTLARLMPITTTVHTGRKGGKR